MQAILDLSKEPIWSLERRPSSGYLVWRRDKSKVRFRFEVEVLEFEKDPDENRICDDYTGPSIISSTIVVFVTCVTAVALTLYLPWYLVGHN